ncbi:MAG: hypothetical protein K0S01_572 [Herbinix sp.]|jgi:ubiquinone/menaquinone biosynthesis C-methylase UbiE|nr:hypothetical protein [Herbinix sp.]
MDINDKIRKRYDRISKIYDIFEQPMEMIALKKFNRRTVNNAKIAGFTNLDVTDLAGDIVKRL